jgi:hypothetical protein
MGVAVTGAGVAVAGGSTGSVTPLQAVRAARSRAAIRGIENIALVGFIRSSFGSWIAFIILHPQLL